MTNKRSPLRLSQSTPRHTMHAIVAQLLYLAGAIDYINLPGIEASITTLVERNRIGLHDAIDLCLQRHGFVWSYISTLDPRRIYDPDGYNYLREDTKRRFGAEAENVWTPQRFAIYQDHLRRRQQLLGPDAREIRPPTMRDVLTFLGKGYFVLILAQAGCDPKNPVSTRPILACDYMKGRKEAPYLKLYDPDRDYASGSDDATVYNLTAEEAALYLAPVANIIAYRRDV